MASQLQLKLILNKYLICYSITSIKNLLTNWACKKCLNTGHLLNLLRKNLVPLEMGHTQTHMQSCRLWSRAQQAISLNHFQSLKGSFNCATMKRTWWTIVSNQWLSIGIIKCPEGCHLSCRHFNRFLEYNPLDTFCQRRSGQ